MLLDREGNRAEEQKIAIVSPDVPIKKMKIKTKIASYSERQKALLSTLYWAANRNKLDLVEKLIEFHHISPFVVNNLAKYI